MSLLFNEIPKVFFAPDVPANTGGPSVKPELTREDMVEFLNEDEDKETIPLEEKKSKKEEPPPEKEKEEEEEEEEELEEKEVDELKELEEELEEPTEDQLELVTPVRRREILAKYPQLFKDFPYLEKAYYREQQFTELLPTLEDAKVAVEAKQILDKFEGEILRGNTETILKAVKEENSDAFHRIIDDYLPTLARVDEKAYYHVIGNVSKHTIMAMIQEARASNNEELAKAAHLLNQFVFGSSNFSPPSNLSRERSPDEKTRESEHKQEKQAFVRQQFDYAHNDLNTRVNNVLRNTIEANIDPRESMTEYVRKTASRDAIEQLEILISRDARFNALKDKLWEKAFDEGFSRDSIDRIRSAYVSKAKTLLPSVIKKARNDALRGMGKRVKEEEIEETEKKGPIPAGQPRSQKTGGKITKPGEIPRGMSTLEFLNSE